MKSIVKYSTLALTAAILAACGGSDSSSTKKTPANNDKATQTKMGKLVNIHNIDYKTTSGKTGKTDDKGMFEYQANDKVTFSIGKVTLPETTAKDKVSLLDIANTTDINNQVVINTQRLTQSLDKDGDASNGIQITDTAKKNATKAISFDTKTTTFASNPDVLNLVQTGGQDKKVDALVSEADAKTALTKTLTDNKISYGENATKFVKEELVGKTVYFAITGSDCNEKGLAVEYTKFNVDGTTTNTNCTGNTSTGSYKIFEDGTLQLNYTATDAFYYGVVSKNPEKGDWLLCASETKITQENARNCPESSTELAFFNKSDAEAYVNEKNGSSDPLKFTKSEVSGKTWYLIDQCGDKKEKGYYTFQFGTDGSFKGADCDGDGTVSETGTYSVTSKGNIFSKFTEDGKQTTEYIKRASKTSSDRFKICFKSAEDGSACSSSSITEVFLSKTAAQTEVNRLNGQ